MDGFMTARFSMVGFLLIFSEPALGPYVRRDSESCPDGYFGPACKTPCWGHCFNNRCYLLPSGRSVNCTEGCVKGWRGTMCSRTCKIGCRQCARYSGKCIGHCRDGYYGPDCSTRCPGNCRKCNSINGRCEGECPIGYYGVFCTNNCSCKKCLKETGECLLVEPLSMAVSLDIVTAGYAHRNTAPIKIGHHGDVQPNTNNQRSSTKRAGDGYDDDDVRSNTYKHKSSITESDDNDDGEEVLLVDIPPQIVAVIVIMSVAAVIMLVAVPFVTMGRFTRCAKRKNEETSYTEKMHVYDEIDDTVVKNWLLSQELDHPQQRMKTEHNEE